VSIFQGKLNVKLPIPRSSWNLTLRVNDGEINFLHAHIFELEIVTKQSPRTKACIVSTSVFISLPGWKMYG